MTDETEMTGDIDRIEQRRTWLTRLAVAVAVAAVIAGLWYVVVKYGRVHTDNAYVGAESAQVTPLVAGAVTEVRVGNTQFVRKGDILLLLDNADARVELATARAALLQAQQRFEQAQVTDTVLDAKLEARGAGVEEAQARLRAAQAEYDKARQAASRREALVGTGAVSAEELTIARADLANRTADLEQARAAVAASEATSVSARGDLAVNRAVTRGMTMDRNPDVAAARARLDAAELTFARTVIRAPISGIVTQRQVQVGQRVAPGTAVMTIVPVEAVYVDANFKENQLRNVRPGQPVELTSDYYGSGVVFHGRVKGVAGGTGSAFSLIPAQNATGNWVKVVQRLPVRITLDPAELRQYPLRVGLTMNVTIDTREQ